MSENRKPQIELQADTTQVRQGFNEIKDAARDMANTLTQEGKKAGQGMDFVGPPTREAVRKVEQTTKSIISSIERTTAALKAGERGTASYYAEIANQRGAQADVLKPYLDSLRQAEAAQKAGKFVDEIAPVTIKGRKGDTVVEQDEYIRHGATLESVAGLRPAFAKDGSVTAANASGLNDGAAALVLMSAEEAAKRGLKPLARIASWANAGVEPEIMGTGPIPASRKALEKAGWSVADLDLVESNEAFAAQSICVVRDLGLDPAKVNVNRGAIAIGHPIGASGARILTTLVHEMKRSGAKKGLATLCVGGGMGVAMCVESV